MRQTKIITPGLSCLWSLQMINSADPRHQKRQFVIQQLFAQEFNPQMKLNELAKKVLDRQTEIDQLIVKAAPTWPIAQVNKTDLVVLRLAIYEILAGQEPIKVIIDEAVELAKEFGSESSGPFVNGVLGKIVE